MYGWYGGVAIVGPGPRVDDPAEVGHGDQVGEVLDDAEVVRDEEIGDPFLVLQIREEIEHDRLDRDVERGEGLVAYHQIRVASECPRDCDALPFASAELVGPARQIATVEIDGMQEVAGAFECRRAAETAEQPDRAGERRCRPCGTD